MTDERKREYTDNDLAELADWAEEQERTTVNTEWKKAYGAIRQGADWLLRRHARMKKEPEASQKFSVISGKETK